MNLKDFTNSLSPAQRVQFLDLAGTTRNYVWQITGGHRRPSLRLLYSMVAASKTMFPKGRRRWLTIPHMLAECDAAAQRHES
jgi:hypothetical protein